MSTRRWPLPFLKYSGAGNDFIILDGRSGEPIGDPGSLAKALCRRGRSVGADGLIVIEAADGDAAEGAQARMRLWNADGSVAEISGNGARCVARFLVDHGAEPDNLSFASDVGLITAQVTGDICRVQLPTTASVFPNRRLRVEGRDLAGTYVEIGVPFFVCFHDDPDELAVRFLGRSIRNHAELAPRGANVDFVRVEDEQRLFFRVYERGVEDETLSSGTGSLSAALAAAAAGKVASPVVCAARGADLTVRFRRVDDARGGRGGAATDGADATTDAPESATGAPPADENREAGDDEHVAASSAELPPLVAEAGADQRIDFVDLEVEGNAMPIYSGEAMVQASRAPRR